MEETYKRRSNETLADYKERLYKNRKNYGLTWEKIAELLGKKQNPDHLRKTNYGYLERIADEKMLNKFDKNIMIINDIHVPFERTDVLEIIAKHKEEIDTLVIGGDFMDCESISSFPKVKNRNLLDEIIYAREFLKKIRNILNNNQKIIIINGNHEERLHKMISKMHEKDLQKFINPNVIDMLVEGFTIYDNGRKIKYNGIDNVIYIPHWYVQVDRIIVSHPKNFSIAKGKMLENVTSHFMNKNLDFDVVIFGHTHKASSGLIDRFSNKIAVENPCLCKPQSYADTGKTNFTQQAYGYTIIKYNKNEKVSYNNIKTYILDEIKDEIKEYKIVL